MDRLLRDVVGPAGQRPRDVPEVAALGQALDRLAQLKQSRESQRRRQKKRRDRKRKTSRTCRNQIVTERGKVDENKFLVWVVHEETVK